MQHLLPWILASLSVGILVVAGLTVVARRRLKKSQPLPREWALTPRPVFSSTERQLYRLLRDALPQQVVLSKLPLVRFCQPTDPQTVRYWYRLLGNSNVNFAVCSSNGRVLAVVDVDSERQPSARSTQIKLAMLSACRIRYLRCTADRLPTVAELQLLVPQNTQPAPSMATASVRRDRLPLWQDSGFMQDSFFGMDGRGQISTNTGFSPSRPGPLLRDFPPTVDDVGGVVIDTPVSPLRH